MTTTYDPFDPAYLDESDLRGELTRVYELCHGCRLCFKFCPAFPTLFELIDRHDDQDAARLTGDEQDRVVDECFNCKVCTVNCPYVPGQHEWELDFARLMLRAKQVKAASGSSSGSRSRKQRLADQFFGRADLVGKLGTTAAPLVNRVAGSPGSPARKVVAKVVGVHAERVLAPYARQRFSSWFKGRARLRFERKQGRVALFATCLVEYQHPAIGRDLVRVYEHNGIECSLPEGQTCCGAPFLHVGDVPAFRKNAAKNLPVLSRAVRDGRAIVVPQPTCSYVLKFDYPRYVGGDSADLVAANTYDAAEYLVRVHRGEATSLQTAFKGTVPDAITYHAPCHLRAQSVGLKSRDLLRLTGTKVTVVAECSGIDGTWGLRAENYEKAKRVARKMVDAVDRAGNETIVGDCALANGGILEETGTLSLHPIQVLARAYGIADE